MTEFKLYRIGDKYVVLDTATKNIKEAFTLTPILPLAKIKADVSCDYYFSLVREMLKLKLPDSKEYRELREIIDGGL